MGTSLDSHFLGKTAVITGAGSGIGRALALALAQRGARLALSDVNEAGLQQTLGLCRTARPQADVRGYRVDVARREDLFGHAQQVQCDFGAVHFVFNNAGVTLLATIEHATIEEIEWQLSINLWGVIYGTKAFLPMMLSQREGHIVNVSSIFGLVGFFGQGAYNISKFGVRGFTECLWRELEGTGVRATTVHPGGIRTEIGHQARYGILADEAEQRVTPLIEKTLITNPADCAREILDGVARGRKRILTGHKARLVDWLARLVPAHYHWLIRRDIGI